VKVQWPTLWMATGVWAVLSGLPLAVYFSFWGWPTNPTLWAIMAGCSVGLIALIYLQDTADLSGQLDRLYARHVEARFPWFDNAVGVVAVASVGVYGFHVHSWRITLGAAIAGIFVARHIFSPPDPTRLPFEDWDKVMEEERENPSPRNVFAERQVQERRLAEKKEAAEQSAEEGGLRDPSDA
jgi:hypothetical protein